MSTCSPFTAFRRCLAYLEADPAFRADFLRDGHKAVESLGFGDQPEPDRMVEALRLIFLEGLRKIDGERRAANPYLEALMSALDTAGETVLRNHGESRFRDRELYVYVNRVRNRCRMENATLRLQENVRYYPLCFELGYGCRLQCGFCGFAAPPFEENFRYTEENRKLWKSLLAGLRRRLGPIAALSACYFATEPFDNPDYELFLRDFREVMGGIPQTTTAAADLQPERIRAFLKEVGEERLRKESAVRFSVRSLAQFHRIMALYSPDELVHVELLLNHPESLGRYSDSGRARLLDRIPDEKRCRYSICCVAGLVVNMARKTVRFMEPMLPDEDYPTGIRTRAELPFDGPDDLLQKADRMYAGYAAGTLRPERIITLNPNIRTETGKDWFRFCGDGISYRVSRGYALERALQELPAGVSFSDVSAELCLLSGAREELYDHLNALYMRGYLIDAREKEER